METPPSQEIPGECRTGTSGCPACGAFRQIAFEAWGLRCAHCGLFEKKAAARFQQPESLVHHYRTQDPYHRVARAKAKFFEQALDFLDREVPFFPRRLIDVGCGWGDFLQRAARRRWEADGVEIVPEAVAAMRRRLPGSRIHLGTLGTLPLAAGRAQAVTFWDVLDHVEDPAAELRAAHRLLAWGGIVGIRTRNATTHLLMRKVDELVSTWCPRPPRKKLHAIHRFAFTPAALEALLHRAGFGDIQVDNALLTQGDPYGLAPRFPLVGLLKAASRPALHALSALSRGRLLLAPSLVAWARKG